MPPQNCSSNGQKEARVPDHMHTRQRYASSDLSESLGLASEQVRRAPEYILRRYTVLGSCGTGGFGTVLECWDTRLQRRVAIKRMPLAAEKTSVPAGSGADAAELAAGGAVGRAGAAAAGGAGIAGGAGAQPGAPAATVVAGQVNLSTISEALGEARTASRLEHPGIVTVHDFEVDRGVAYLVMEYVDGMTLTELLSRVEGGTLTHDECAYLAQQLGEALGFAHEHGVLHLDIKPSNIMFTSDGKVKLCDFGMATLASAAGYADARGGTVGYMPPEQIRGELVDERTDIFSLAVVLYQALFGYDPFLAPTAEQSLALIDRGPKPKPSKADPYLAGITEETLLACLSPDPGARPTNAAEVGNDLAFGLGDPDEGAASIADLTGQAAGDEDDEDAWQGERLPLSVRFPWAYPLLIRLCTGLAAGACAYSLAPYALPGEDIPAQLVALIVGAAGAAWTPLASAAALLLFAMAVVAGTGAGTVGAASGAGAGAVAGAASGAGVAAGTTAATAARTSGAGAILLAGIVVALGAVWWLRTRKDKPAALALLVAPALAQPAAAAAVAGATLTPVKAAATATLAWAAARLVPALAQRAFASSLLVEALTSAFVLPGPAACAISCAGVAAGAAIAAAVAHSGASGTRSGGSVARGVVGQALAAAVVVAAQLFAARLENGGIWPAPAWSTVGVAVTLGSFVCIALALRGPRDPDGEDED